MPSARGEVLRESRERESVSARAARNESGREREKNEKVAPRDAPPSRRNKNTPPPLYFFFLLNPKIFGQNNLKRKKPFRCVQKCARIARRADGAAPLPVAAARCPAPRSPGPAAAPGPTTQARGGGRRALLPARCLFFFPRHRVICQDNRGGEKQFLPHTHAHLPPPPFPLAPPHLPPAGPK